MCALINIRFRKRSANCLLSDGRFSTHSHGWASNEGFVIKSRSLILTIVSTQNPHCEEAMNNHPACALSGKRSEALVYRLIVFHSDKRVPNDGNIR